MNLDDTISKINSIDPVALEERLRIKKPHEGLEIFCDWFKQKNKESEQASTWKIPVECIPKKNVVTLSIAEAKLIFEALLRLPVEGNKALLKHTLIPLKEKIEKAEKCDRD